LPIALRHNVAYVPFFACVQKGGRALAFQAASIFIFQLKRKREQSKNENRYLRATRKSSGQRKGVPVILSELK